MEPPFRVTFPKLREPVHEYGEAMDYMKGDMEKLYGGTVGDRGLVYLEELEKAKRERGMARAFGASVVMGAKA